MEEDVADKDEPLKFPYEFNNIKPEKKEGKPEKPKFHFAITGKEMRKACGCSHDTTKVKRNVIIGDTIQTDYSEIRIRHKGKNKWMSKPSLRPWWTFWAKNVEPLTSPSCQTVISVSSTVIQEELAMLTKWLTFR